MTDNRLTTEVACNRALAVEETKELLAVLRREGWQSGNCGYLGR